MNVRVLHQWSSQITDSVESCPAQAMVCCHDTPTSKVNPRLEAGPDDSSRLLTALRMSPRDLSLAPGTQPFEDTESVHFLYTTFNLERPWFTGDTYILRGTSISTAATRTPSFPFPPSPFLQIQGNRRKTWDGCTTTINQYFLTV